MTCDHIIGVYYDYEDSKLISFADLKDIVLQQLTMQENLLELGVSYSISTYTLADYFDLRKTVNMYRFNYCPFCGEKIDWKGLKEEAKRCMLRK